MRVCVIDCGTSTTRVIIAEGRTILAKHSVPVGVRNTAITGNNQELKAGISSCWNEALSSAGVSPQEIKVTIASGMITSNLGLIDLPHLVAPVGEDDLRANVVVKHFPDVIPVPIHFVRGVRNAVDFETEEAYTSVDFMRGEEAQVVGLLHLLNLEPPLTIINLSSHTKIIGIDGTKRIMGSVTTLSGQLFAALRESTLIADSLPKNRAVPVSELDRDMVRRGFETVRDFGLLRAIFVPRLHDVLLGLSPTDCLSFLEGALIGGDIQSFPLVQHLNLPMDRFVITGDPMRVELFRDLLAQVPGCTAEIQTVDPATMDQATLVGGIEIAAGL